MKKIAAIISMYLLCAVAIAKVVHPVANLTVDVPASWAGYGATCSLETPTTTISRLADVQGRCYFGYVNYPGTYTVNAYRLNQYSQADGTTSTDTFSLSPVGSNPTPTIVIVLE